MDNKKSDDLMVITLFLRIALAAKFRIFFLILIYMEKIFNEVNECSYCAGTKHG